MQQRLVLSQQAFYLGLVIMLTAGVLSAGWWSNDGYAMPALTLAGGGLALAARLWHRRLRRGAHRAGRLIDVGGYPIDMLRDPRFIARRRRRVA